MTIRLLQGDCRVTLPTLPERSVQACVTSPPYWGLRSYIKDGDPLKPFEIGLEPTPELFIEHLVECFRHVRPALKDDGVVWLNLGDSYAGSGKGPTGWNGIGDQGERQGFVGGRGKRPELAKPPSGWAERAVTPPSWAPPGYKPKDLLMIPARVAMALQADGWWLRSMIPWLKRNSMPESVQDRPASAVEYVFLLSKSRTYYWDADAIRAPLIGRTVRDGIDTHGGGQGSGAMTQNSAGRNRRNTDWFFESWQGLLADEQAGPLAFVVNPAPYKGAHFATFPPKLVEPMILASTRPGDTVLDPFGGSGTTGMVADRLGRNAILCELSADYGEQAVQRVSGDAPMFTEVEVA